MKTTCPPNCALRLRQRLACALLIVQTAGERDALQQAASRQGLGRLTQISLLVLIAGVLEIGRAHV